MAITDYDGYGYVIESDDKQALRFSRNNESKIRVPCSMLRTYMTDVRVNFFDLIKVDIEGSEYDVIMSLNKPPATQLSIEFHLHTGVYGSKEMSDMGNKLKQLGYFTIQHNKYEAHGCSENYWDSVFILK